MAVPLIGPQLSYAYDLSANAKAVGILYDLRFETALVGLGSGILSTDTGR